MITQDYLNKLTYTIIGYAVEVQKELGPGLLESVYETCMHHLLITNGHNVVRQLKVPIVFKNITLDAELRLDLLVDDLIVVELKATDGIHPIFKAQTLTYMKLLNKPKGLILNFNSLNVANEGKETLVNHLYKALPKGY